MEQLGYRNRNGMIPYAPYLIPGGILHLGHAGIQPRMMNGQDAHVLDHHFILNQHNINSIFTQTRDIQATRRRYNTDRVSSQDGHFILQGQVNQQVPIRRDVGTTIRHVDRNQPRVSTQSAYAYYFQDGHFVLHENIGQVNQQVPTRRDIGGGMQKRFDALERIIIQQVPTDSEAMACSICLEDFSVGLEAIRLPSPCLHVYHKDCIFEWLDRSSTCPSCRRPVLSLL